MNRALVTGGAGFIGSHLCQALVKKGYTVDCIDNYTTGKPQNIRREFGVNMYEADVNDESVFTKLEKDGRTYDVLFHYAATVGVRRTQEQPIHVLDDIKGIRNVAQFARNGNAKKIIFASSSEVYGEPHRLPEMEEDGHIGWSPYTVTKLYGEHLFHALWEQENIPTVSLRFFNVYGPRQIASGYGFVTGVFLKQVASGQAPTVYGDGKQTRDFVYIDDNIRAALAAATRDEANGHIVNVGSGIETSIHALANYAIKAAKQSGEMFPQFFPARTIEIQRRCASTKKMQDLLNVSCNTPVEKGIKETLPWYENHAQAPTHATPALETA